MHRTDIQSLFINILRSEITGVEIDNTSLQDLSSDALSALYVLSKKHDLAHIVSAALGKASLFENEEIIKKFKQQEILSVYRYERMNYIYAIVCAEFEKANIMYIPLKGSVIRPYYPKESMRTSSDIDIFIKREDIQRACAVLGKGLGYEKNGEHFSEISFMAQNTVHIELHFFAENDSSRDFDGFENVWEYCYSENSCKYLMKNEFFLFYHISHMAKHFNGGGCGVRPFLDLWVMENLMGIERTCANELLEKVGFKNFSKGIFELSDVWFCEKEHSQLTCLMQEYILNGGVYGSFKNSSTVAQVKKENKFLCLWHKIFLPYKNLCFMFPSLKKCPLLLPICHIRRWWRIFTRKGGTKGAFYKIKTDLSITDADKRVVLEMFNELGLKE